LTGPSGWHAGGPGGSSPPGNTARRRSARPGAACWSRRAPRPCRTPPASGS
jgi:hypothetical protein